MTTPAAGDGSNGAAGAAGAGNGGQAGAGAAGGAAAAGAGAAAGNQAGGTPAAGGFAAALAENGQPAAGGAAAAAAAPAIPESYDFKKPDGYKGVDADIARVQGMAKAGKLTAEQAQALFEADAANIAEQDAAIERETAQTRADNIAALKADPEFGGPKYAESITRADQALAILDPKGELLAELKQFGLEHHPNLVRAFARAGQMMTEGNTFVQAKGGPPESKAASLLEFYPTMK